MTPDLFAAEAGGRVALGEQACILNGFALPHEDALLAGVREAEAQSPFRHMKTRGGHTMSVALTNCGDLGWTSDERGYRYTRIDPLTGCAWPRMPAALRGLAVAAAAEAGFAHFETDACLINRYVAGSKLSLHQDRDEQHYDYPIVSVSLGSDAIFAFGGNARSDKTQRYRLVHGDVVVWGGVDRLRFHGVAELKQPAHPLLGPLRINLTFRKAG